MNELNLHVKRDEMTAGQIFDDAWRRAQSKVRLRELLGDAKAGATAAPADATPSELHARSHAF